MDSLAGDSLWQRILAPERPGRKVPPLLARGRVRVAGVHLERYRGGGNSIAGRDSVTVERTIGAASTPTAKHFVRQCMTVKRTYLIVGFQRTPI